MAQFPNIYFQDHIDISKKYWLLSHKLYVSCLQMNIFQAKCFNHITDPWKYVLYMIRDPTQKCPKTGKNNKSSEYITLGHQATNWWFVPKFTKADIGFYTIGGSEKNIAVWAQIWYRFPMFGSSRNFRESPNLAILKNKNHFSTYFAKRVHRLCNDIYKR